MTQEEMKLPESPVEQEEPKNTVSKELDQEEAEVSSLDVIAVKAEIVVVEAKEAVVATIVAVNTVEKEVSSKGAYGILVAFPAIRRAFCEIGQAVRASWILLKNVSFVCRSKPKKAEVLNVPLEEPSQSV